MTPDDYTSAVDVPGLDLARARLLVEHILSRNRALVECSPVPLAVARCAAALMAADEKLPSPMALAQAEALAQLPEVGPALMSMQENLMVVFKRLGGAFKDDGIQRQTVARVLRHLIAEGARLLANWNPPLAN
jgi:hypothetical protein